jgi:hypothetical protein
MGSRMKKMGVLFPTRSQFPVFVSIVGWLLVVDKCALFYWVVGLFALFALFVCLSCFICVCECVEGLEGGVGLHQVSVPCTCGGGWWWFV